MFGRRKSDNHAAGTRTFLNRRGIIVVCLCVLSLFVLTAYSAYAGLFALEQCNYCAGTKSNEVQCDSCDGRGKITIETPCNKCDGVKETIKNKACVNCDGDGKTWGALGFYLDCGVCEGDGTIEISENCVACNGLGIETLNSECATCFGMGKIIKPCSMCGESGQIMRMLNKRAGT